MLHIFQPIKTQGFLERRKTRLTTAAHPPAQCRFCTTSSCSALVWPCPFYTWSPLCRPRSWRWACLSARPSVELGERVAAANEWSRQPHDVQYSEYSRWRQGSLLSPDNNLTPPVVTHTLINQNLPIIPVPVPDCSQFTVLLYNQCSVGTYRDDDDICNPLQFREKKKKDLKKMHGVNTLAWIQL